MNYTHYMHTVIICFALLVALVSQALLSEVLPAQASHQLVEVQESR